jgi:hypothetical protein
MKNLYPLFLILFAYAGFGQTCQHNKQANGIHSAQTAPANLRSDTIDVLHEEISLAITDFVTDTIRGNTRITFHPKMNGQSHITLDLLTMKIDSVSCQGQLMSYDYNDTILVAGLPAAYNITDTVTLTVYYHGVPKTDPSGWGGFSITSTYAYNLGVGFSADFHAFGRCWFPCFDNFLERCTFTFNIISPPGKRSVCNGTLTKDSLDGSNFNYRTWKLNQPIPTYLASVAVANYVFVNKTFNGLNGPVPVKLAALAIDTNNLKNSFVNLQNAFNCYEQHYGPYMWPRVGYVCVPFNSGAMEHATNIAYPLPFVNGATTYEDVLMAHELSHHWWGDLVTCETPQEMYINEGFASFNQSLFNECVYGQTKYITNILDNHDNSLHNAHIADKGFYSLSNVPLAYTYGDHSYNKGADMAYNLRTYLGDSLFFAGTKFVLQQRAFQRLNSSLFDSLLTAYTGINTGDYFNDWINNPGWPHFSIDSMAVNGNNATVYVRQRLYKAPAFFQNVPLEIMFMDANRNRSLKEVMVSGQFSSFSLTLPFTPVYAGINFNNRISDAVTSTQKTLLQTGNIVYVHGRATVGVYTTGSDSSFIRIEHNFVGPDAIKNNVNNYRINTQHYWKVDGLLAPGFRASLKLYFNGKKILNRAPGSTDYLDTCLTQFTADSLILLYRPNTAGDWTEVSSYTKVKLGGTTSVYGYVTADTLKAGEYCFANGKSNVIGISKASKRNFIGIFPNPASDLLTIDLERAAVIPEKVTCTVFAADGRKMLAQEFSGEKFTLDVSGLAKGYYTIKLIGKDLQYSQKLMIMPR